MKMLKKTIEKDDGRYLIYYTFTEQEGEPQEGKNEEQEGEEQDVRAAMEPDS